jgi:hypothetical protein
MEAAGNPGADLGQEAPTAEMPPLSIGESPTAASTAGTDAFAERPQVFLGAAFAGGLAIAQLLKKLGR